MAKRNLSEKRLNELKPLVGAFIRAIRRTSLIPSVERLYKETYNKSVESAWCRHFKAVMEATVAHFDPDGSARLYRDERTAEEVMPLVKDMWTKVETPAPRPHHKKEKSTMADLVYDETTGEFHSPEEVKEPQKQLFNIDLSSYKDEDLPALQEAIAKAFADEQLRREEARKEAERHAKIQQTLAVIKEMLASEEITWDEILKEDGII